MEMASILLIEGWAVLGCAIAGAALVIFLNGLDDTFLDLSWLVARLTTRERKPTDAMLETKAHIFASDMAERMRLSRQPNAYLRKFSDPIPSADDCTAQLCENVTQLAAWDLQEWMTRIENQLPSGQAQIVLEDAAYREYSVTVRYDDQRGAAEAGSEATAFREVMVVTRL